MSCDSRFQKLLSLVENATESDIRDAACHSIRDIAASHPQQLPSILQKIGPLLRHKNWDCRVSAGEILHLLAQHFCHHSVQDLCQIRSLNNPEEEASESKRIRLDALAPNTTHFEAYTYLSMSLRKFDVDEILRLGTELKASDSKFCNTTSIVSDRTVHSGISVRQKNQLKRKKRSHERSHHSSSLEFLGPCQSLDALSTISSIKSETESIETIDDSILDGRWPFGKIFETLIVDMMDSVWEIRHGAVLGLRELLSIQAPSAGVKVELMTEVLSGWAVSGKSTLRDICPFKDDLFFQNLANNRRCLEDCCAKILELIVLDRMGDYLSYPMVAPVRETASQAFGCCLPFLPIETIRQFFAIIQQMVVNRAWEVRHSGYVLLKYIFTSQKGLQVCKGGIFIECVLKGLEDAMDEVRAAAADVLVPAAPSLSMALDPNDLLILRDVLWRNLTDVDDLNAATPSILHLLWKLYSKNEERNLENLKDRVPLLFPFFGHTSTAARTSALQCFYHLLNFRTQMRPFVSKVARLVFFNLLTETEEEILQLNEDIWQSLMEFESEDLFHGWDSQLLENMVQMACTPNGTTLKGHLLEYLIGDAGECTGEDITIGSQFSGNPYRMRFAVSRALAFLFRKMPESQHRILELSNSSSATTQFVFSLIGHFWYEQNHLPDSNAVEYPEILQKAVVDLLSRNVDYSELSGYEKKLKSEYAALLNELGASFGSQITSQVNFIDTLTPFQIQSQTAVFFKDFMHSTESIVGLQQHINASAKNVIDLQRILKSQVHACAASVLVDKGCVPNKLNGIVQPLMNSVRTEKEPLLQNMFAFELAQLIILCHGRKLGIQKIIQNVCTMACEGEAIDPPGPLEAIEQLGINVALCCTSSNASFESIVSKRGAEHVLKVLTQKLGSDLFSKVPSLWEEMTKGMIQSHPDTLRSIRILQIVGSAFEIEWLPQLTDLVTQICQLSVSDTLTNCIASSRCLASLVKSQTEILFPVVLDQLMPLLSVNSKEERLKAALIVLHHILEKLSTKVVPYIVLILVPLLALMAHHDTIVRIISASSFGKLTSLLPLMSISSVPPPNLTPYQNELFQKNMAFVKTLMDNKKGVNFEIPKGLMVEIRGYQLEGIGWMDFLRRSGLHGILADDMGLGKTLQTLIAVYLSKKERSDAADEEETIRPSLVVCPSTLLSHWCNEVATLFPPGCLSTLAYAGGIGDRQDLRHSISGYDLVVMSYETLRIDIPWIASVEWDYCILDEGQIIRNVKSKVWKSCKAIQARHRLILSGTPVQNGVLELWALFDFLMPGFLGTLKDFTQQYGRIIHSARYAKNDSSESIHGDRALSSLHKRVAPFIMRRIKDEVLHDLPPKIIQDVFCDLSDIQKVLYETFSETQMEKTKESGKMTSLESLQYLRYLTSHPLLVLDWDNASQRTMVQKVLNRDFENREAWEEEFSRMVHAPKLQMMNELLCQCGIGLSQSPLTEDASGSHRMLIFAQSKKLLSLVEKHLLRPMEISYLRLDGSIPPSERSSIVQQFNSDPTISVLLLTTKVGGLGLNLASADVVTFLEHDWNPMNDIQAMDRAHRLGQKRTVNVYRILTRGTIEEKIMSLQRFKVRVANSLINEDSMSLDSMDTGHLLDLFAYSNPQPKSKTMDITDEDYAVRYEKEFDMDRFAKRMG